MGSLGWTRRAQKRLINSPLSLKFSKCLHSSFGWVARRLVESTGLLMPHIKWGPVDPQISCIWTAQLGTDLSFKASSLIGFGPHDAIFTSNWQSFQIWSTMAAYRICRDLVWNTHLPFMKHIPSPTPFLHLAGSPILTSSLSLRK